MDYPTTRPTNITKNYDSIHQEIRRGRFAAAMDLLGGERGASEATGEKDLELWFRVYALQGWWQQAEQILYRMQNSVIRQRLEAVLATHRATEAQLLAF